MKLTPVGNVPESNIVAEVVVVIPYWSAVPNELLIQTVGFGLPDTTLTVAFSFISIVPVYVVWSQIPYDCTV